MSNPHSTQRRKQRKNGTPLLRMLLAFVIAFVYGAVFTGIGQTLAYYSDTESAFGNLFRTGKLDMRLTESGADAFVGKEYHGEHDAVTVVLPESGSMPMQYSVAMATTSAACSAFTMRAEKNEVEVYAGAVSGFPAMPASTDFGTWDFTFDLPVGALVTQGDTCSTDLLFHAWREESVTPEASGYDDTETFSVTLRAKTIVLNEILADPDPDAPYPANKEFIELKNNGVAPVDVAGWEISEMTGGGSEVRHTITLATSTAGALIPVEGTTVIPVGGWLTLLFNGNASYLNNGGDTVRLYDTPETGTLLDEYAYSSAKFGNSDARFADGIGMWVDPRPTPGQQNVIDDVKAYITQLVEAEKATTTDTIATTTDTAVPLAGGESSADAVVATSTGATSSEALAGAAVAVADEAASSTEEIATSSASETVGEATTSESTTTPEVLEATGDSSGGGTDTSTTAPADSSDTDESANVIVDDAPAVKEEGDVTPEVIGGESGASGEGDGSTADSAPAEEVVNDTAPEAEPAPAPAEVVVRAPAVVPEAPSAETSSAGAGAGDSAGDNAGSDAPAAEII